MSPRFRLQILVLSICLLLEFSFQGSASEIQRLGKGHSLYRYDNWSKRNVPDFSSWRQLGSIEHYEIVAIPRIDAEEVESVSKRGAYLDLPWG
nr:neuropeptide [Hymenolepis microstoma]